MFLHFVSYCDSFSLGLFAPFHGGKLPIKVLKIILYVKGTRKKEFWGSKLYLFRINVMGLMQLL
jgi:hypothetical protein